MNDRDVAKIVEMGFTSDQASSALRQCDGNLQSAINTLLSNGVEGNSGSSGFGRGRGRGRFENNRDDRPERGMCVYLILISILKALEDII